MDEEIKKLEKLILEGNITPEEQQLAIKELEDISNTFDETIKSKTKAPAKPIKVEVVNSPAIKIPSVTIPRESFPENMGIKKPAWLPLLFSPLKPIKQVLDNISSQLKDLNAKETPEMKWPRKDKDAIPVKVTNQIQSVKWAGGGSSSPSFTKSNGEITQALIDDDRHAQVDVLTMPDITISTGDIEIGAVEIKNGSDDTRATVAAGDTNQNSLLTVGGAKTVSFTTTTVQAVATTDCLNYRWVSVQINTQGTSSTITFQVSNDNTNWVSQALINSVGTSTTVAAVSSAAAAGVIFHGAIGARYFRLNVTGISAGTTAGTVQFFAHGSSNVGSSYAYAGVGTAGYQKLEDVASAGGDAGIAAYGIRLDTPVVNANVSASGDYLPLITDNLGKLWSADNQSEDAAHTSGDRGSFMLGVRNDSGATTYGADQDYYPIATDANGRVGIADLGGSITVDNAGTFAVQATLDAETTKVIGTVNQGTSPWVISGAVTNTVLSVVGGGLEATAQRVTIASDSTGILTVKQATAGNLNMTEASASAIKTSVELIDNAISGAGFNITQFGGAAVPIGAGLEATAIRVTLPTNGTGIVGLATGSNVIGKLAANSGVDIGDVTLTAGSASIGVLGANSGVDIGDVTINNASGASAVNIQDGGNTITVDGTVAFSNSTIAVTNAGTFATQETPLTFVGNFQTTVTTAGTRVQLANHSAQAVTVKAKSTNTGLIYVGDSAVSSSTGLILSAGESISLDINNTALVYIDSSVNAEGVSVIYVN